MLAHPLPLPAPALVIGSTGGIGGALVAQLAERGIAAEGLSRRVHGLDVAVEASIERALRGPFPAPRLVIVATGVLHDAELSPEKSLAALDPKHLARSFAVNAIGPALLAKHVLPRMPRDGRNIFAVLSARVGSIDDNRLGGWHAYRASKAALNQLVRTMAIERSRQAPESILVSLHPGTVATSLSAPFRHGSATVAPERSASRLLDVIARLESADSGGFFAWDGSSIPY